MRKVMPAIVVAIAGFAACQDDVTTPPQSSLPEAAQVVPDAFYYHDARPVELVADYSRVVVETDVGSPVAVAQGLLEPLGIRVQDDRPVNQLPRHSLVLPLPPIL